MGEEFFEYSPPPFIEELEKYNSGKNELKVSRGDLKFRNRETDLYIIRIDVDPDQRHSGIGNEMISTIKKLGKEHGFRKIWLKASFSTTFSCNAMSFGELKNWYIRNGFKICEDLGYEVYMFYDI